MNARHHAGEKRETAGDERGKQHRADRGGKPEPAATYQSKDRGRNEEDAENCQSLERSPLEAPVGVFSIQRPALGSRRLT